MKLIAHNDEQLIFLGAHLKTFSHLADIVENVCTLIDPTIKARWFYNKVLHMYITDQLHLCYVLCYGGHRPLKKKSGMGIFRQRSLRPLERCVRGCTHPSTALCRNLSESAPVRILESLVKGGFGVVLGLCKMNNFISFWKQKSKKKTCLLPM